MCPKHRSLHPEKQPLLPDSCSSAQLGHNHVLIGTKFSKHPSWLHSCRSSFLDQGFPSGQCNSGVNLKGLSEALSCDILWAQAHTAIQSGVETVSVG